MVQRGSITFWLPAEKSVRVALRTQSISPLNPEPATASCQCTLGKRSPSSATTNRTAVSPKMSEFKGDPCYPDLGSIPEKPDAVFMMTSPKVSEEIVRQAVEVGVKHVWMHCMMGTKPGLVESMTSVSQEAVAMCRENGIQVIPGTCPAQFLNPDFGHRMMRGLWRAFGLLKIQTHA